jgi:hypothetical protein
MQFPDDGAVATSPSRSAERGARQCEPVLLLRFFLEYMKILTGVLAREHGVAGDPFILQKPPQHSPGWSSSGIDGGYVTAQATDHTSDVHAPASRITPGFLAAQFVVRNHPVHGRGEIQRRIER